MPDVDGVTLHTVMLRPRAEGWVRLRSADPGDLPLVNPNYLGHPDDMAHHIAGVRAAREIMRTRPLADVLTAELLPGPSATDRRGHRGPPPPVRPDRLPPVGTCRMGRAGAPDTVVTPDLRVQGVEGLRVIDASIMPKLVSANTNAPTMALADRAVSIMRGVEGVVEAGGSGGRA